MPMVKIFGNDSQPEYVNSEEQNGACYVQLDKFGGNHLPPL
jgi:hypothetical protein